MTDTRHRTVLIEDDGIVLAGTVDGVRYRFDFRTLQWRDREGVLAPYAVSEALTVAMKAKAS